MYISIIYSLPYSSVNLPKQSLMPYMFPPCHSHSLIIQSSSFMVTSNANVSCPARLSHLFSNTNTLDILVVMKREFTHIIHITKSNTIKDVQPSPLGGLSKSDFENKSLLVNGSTTFSCLKQVRH